MDPLPEAEADPMDSPADAITDLSLQSISKYNNRSDRNSITLSWSEPNDNGSPILFYNVQVYGSTSNSWQVLENDVYGTTYTHNNAPVNIQMTYRVYAIAEDGCNGNTSSYYNACNESNILSVVSLPDGESGTPISQCDNSWLDDCGYFDDTTPPVIIISPDVFTFAATSSSGYLADDLTLRDMMYSAISASDNVAIDTERYGNIWSIAYQIGATGIECNNESNWKMASEEFPIGDTIIGCWVYDTSGNQGTATFTVTVTDYVAADITAPVLAWGQANMSAQFGMSGLSHTNSTTNESGMVLPWFVSSGYTSTFNQGSGPPGLTAWDDVGVTSGPTCNPAFGSTFPVGTTTVTCTASDAAGNVGTASFTVTVVLEGATDTESPVVSIWPGDWNVNVFSGTGGKELWYPVLQPMENSRAYSPDGTVWYDSGAKITNVEDRYDTNASLSCDPPPGSTFPVGSTTVTCTATDAAGKTGTATFTVTVNEIPQPSESQCRAMAFTSGYSADYAAYSTADCTVGMLSSTVNVPLGFRIQTYGLNGDQPDWWWGMFGKAFNQNGEQVGSCGSNMSGLPSAWGGLGTYYCKNPWDPSHVTTINVVQPVDLGISFQNVSVGLGGGDAFSNSYVMYGTVVNSNNYNAENVMVYTHITDSSGSYITSRHDTILDAPQHNNVKSIAPGSSTFSIPLTPVDGGTFTPYAVGGLTPNPGGIFDGSNNSPSEEEAATMYDITAPNVTFYDMSQSSHTNSTTNQSGMVLPWFVSSGGGVPPGLAAWDEVGVTSGPTCNPAFGSTFPVGTTTVTCTASDAAGNVGTMSFTVTVVLEEVSADTPIIITSLEAYEWTNGNTWKWKYHAVIEALPGINIAHMLSKPADSPCLSDNTFPCDRIVSAGTMYNVEEHIEMDSYVGGFVANDHNIALGYGIPPNGKFTIPGTWALILCQTTEEWNVGVMDDTCVEQNFTITQGSFSSEPSLRCDMFIGDANDLLSPNAVGISSLEDVETCLGAGYSYGGGLDAWNGISASAYVNATSPTGRTLQVTVNNIQDGTIISFIPQTETASGGFASFDTDNLGSDGWEWQRLYGGEPLCTNCDPADNTWQAPIPANWGTSETTYASGDELRIFWRLSSEAGFPSAIMIGGNNIDGLTSPITVPAPPGGAADTTLPVVTVPSNQSFSTTNSTGVMYYHDQNGVAIIRADDNVGFTKSSGDSTSTSIGPGIGGSLQFGQDSGWSQALHCGKTGAGTGSLSSYSGEFEHYPVGTTTVTCTATDSSGNVGTASFTVTVHLEGQLQNTVTTDMTTYVAYGLPGAGSVVTISGTVSQSYIDNYPTICGDFPVTEVWVWLEPLGGGVRVHGLPNSSFVGWLPTGHFSTEASLQYPRIGDVGEHIIELQSYHNVGNGCEQSNIALATASYTVTTDTSFAPTPQVNATSTTPGTNTTSTFTPTGDTISPDIVVPDDIFDASTDPTGNPVYFANPIATDNVGVTSGPTCNPLSGTFFNVGSTTVTCTAIDAAGNVASDSFTVNVTYSISDTSQPVFPQISSVDVSTEATDYIYNYAIPTPFDDVGITVGPTCNPPPGSLLSVGTTTITCTASDAAGNTGTVSYDVTVVNTEAIGNTVSPEFEPHDDIFQETNIANGSPVYYITPTATDDEEVTDGPTCTPASGWFFPIGDTVVICTAKDEAGNQGVVSFTVSVEYTGQISQDVSVDITGTPEIVIQDVLISGDAENSVSAGNLAKFTTSISSNSTSNALVAITVEDKDGVALGVGYFKSILGLDNELQLGFNIPKDAVSGVANVYVNVYTDWLPGGIPLTDEVEVTIDIIGTDPTDLGAFNYYVDPIDTGIYKTAPGFDAQNIVNGAISYWQGSPPVETFNLWSDVLEYSVNSYANSKVPFDDNFVTDLTFSQKVGDNPDINLEIFWVKEYGTFGTVGIAPISTYEDVAVDNIFMGLGDSICLDTWQPYSKKYLTETLQHEMGHIIGFAHDDNPNSLMYYTSSDAYPREYGIVEKSFTTTEGYADFIPICTSRDQTNFNYSVSVDSGDIGVDVKFVRSGDALDSWVAGESFEVYAGCSDDDMLYVTNTCNNVEQGSGLLIIMPEQSTGILTDVTVKMQENFDGTQTISDVLESQVAPIISSDVAKTKLDLLEQVVDVDLEIELLDGEKFLTIEDTVITQDVDKFTIVGWIQPDFSKGSQELTVVSKQDSFKMFLTKESFEQKGGHTVAVPDQTLSLSLYDGMKWFTISSDTQLTEDWYYVAAVVDGSKATLYLDGEVEGKLKLQEKMVLGICNEEECFADVKMSVSDKGIVIGAYSEFYGSYNQQGILVENHRDFDNFSGFISSVEVYSSAFTDRQISKLYEENKNRFQKDGSTESIAMGTESPALSDSECLDLAKERGLEVELQGTYTLVCQFPFDVIIPLNSKILWMETLPLYGGPYHIINSVDELFTTGFVPFASIDFYEPDFTYGVYEYVDKLNESLTGKIIIAQPLLVPKDPDNYSTATKSWNAEPIKIARDSASPKCEINNSCYLPFAINIDVDQEVTWRNEDSFNHSVTSGTAEDGPDGIFDSGVLRNSIYFSHIFSERGIYDYYCTFHPWMNGMVIVGEI